MAKTSTKEKVAKPTESNVRFEAFKKVLKEIDTKNKITNISLLPEMSEANVETISTGSLILDSIIGGGVPKGRIIEIYGAEASGKTSIALTMAANVQKEGGNVVFLDVEQAFDPKYARKLGVDTDKLAFAQPVIAEDVLRIVKELASSGTTDMIIVDSVASMVPLAESEADFEKASVGALARLMSKALKQIASVANNNKCTLVLLNQVRDNVGVLYGSPTTTPGGKALKFYASQRIEVKRKGKVDDENGNNIGNDVYLKCVKNKIAPPFGEGLTVLTYKKGINKAAELFVLGEDLKVLHKEGRTFYCENPENIDISGYGATVEPDGRIKIGVNSKPVLKEIEQNKKLYELLAKQVVSALEKKNGLVDDEEEEEEILEEDLEDLDLE